MLILILKLLLAHFLGDFVFQPNKWEKSKRKVKVKSPYLYLHILAHGLLLLIVIGFDFHFLIGVGVILISHYMIDLGKLYLYEKVNEQVLFFVDQALHIFILICVANVYYPIKWNIYDFITPKTIALTIAIISLTSVSSICMKVLISNWKPVEKKTLKRAGTYIGMLERLFIFGFITINYWEGIGFLLAAKSVFRFGDLSNAKDRNLTEYVLIGTLLSFGIAILIGRGYLYVLNFVS